MHAVRHLTAGDLEIEDLVRSADIAAAIDVVLAAQGHRRRHRSIQSQTFIDDVFLALGAQLVQRRHLDPDHQGIPRVDPVGVQDVPVTLPQLGPEIGIAVEPIRKIPEGIALLDDVDLGSFRKGGRRVPGSPVVSHQTEVAWRSCIRHQPSGPEHQNGQSQGSGNARCHTWTSFAASAVVSR